MPKNRIELAVEYGGLLIRSWDEEGTLTHYWFDYMGQRADRNMVLCAEVEYRGNKRVYQDEFHLPNDIQGWLEDRNYTIQRLSDEEE